MGNTPRARQEARKSAQRSEVRGLRWNETECGETGIYQPKPESQAGPQTAQDGRQHADPHADVLLNDAPDRQHEKAEHREPCVQAACLKHARRPDALPLHLARQTIENHDPGDHADEALQHGNPMELEAE